jgi:hypothetical protein
MFSVRTEDRSAPLAGLRNVSTTSGQRMLASIKLLVLRRGQRNSLPDRKVARRFWATGGGKFQVAESRLNINFMFV